jgi:hypothetical protein
MNFQPKTEKEIADSKLLPKGSYAFLVLEAAEKTSSNNNPMLELKLRVSNGNGLSRTLFDYLLPQRADKLRHAAAACGVLDRYDAGEVSDSDFRGKRGRLMLAVEKGKKGYPDKNVVEDYLAG